MTSFDAAELERRLGRLNGTQSAIESVSRWIAARDTFANEVVQCWEKCFESASASSLLLLLYVANDVIQTTKRKTNAWTEAFFTPMGRAFAAGLQRNDPKLKEKIPRLVNVWEERKIYDKEELALFHHVLRSNGKSLPEYFKMGGVKTEEEIDVEKELAKAEASVVDEFTGDLESSGDESEDDFTDPVLIRAEASKIASSDETTLELEHDDLGEKYSNFLADVEAMEFEEVGDALVLENVKRVKVLTEKLRGNIEKVDGDTSQLDPRYELITVEENIKLDFASANKVLLNAQERLDAASKREKNIATQCEQFMEESAQKMDRFTENLTTLTMEHRSFRSLVRIVYLEQNRRKRKRLREKRNHEINEELERRREASRPLDSEDAVESFLATFKSKFSKSKLIPPAPAGSPPPENRYRQVRAPPSKPPGGNRLKSKPSTM